MIDVIADETFIVFLMLHVSLEKMTSYLKFILFTNENIMSHMKNNYFKEHGTILVDPLVLLFKKKLKYKLCYSFGVN